MMASVLIQTKNVFPVFAHHLAANIFYSLHYVTVACIRPTVRYCVHCTEHDHANVITEVFCKYA